MKKKKILEMYVELNEEYQALLGRDDAIDSHVRAENKTLKQSISALEALLAGYEAGSVPDNLDDVAVWQRKCNELESELKVVKIKLDRAGRKVLDAKYGGGGW